MRSRARDFWEIWRTLRMHAAKEEVDRAAYALCNGARCAKTRDVVLQFSQTAWSSFMNTYLIVRNDHAHLWCDPRRNCPLCAI